jgi:hypothetical protein
MIEFLSSVKACEEDYRKQNNLTKQKMITMWYDNNLNYCIQADGFEVQKYKEEFHQKWVKIS